MDTAKYRELTFKKILPQLVNDVTFRILLIVMLTWNLKAKIVDIKTAFLHGDLKETIYMEIPKGLKAEENECLLLKKKIWASSRAQENLIENLFRL